LTAVEGWRDAVREAAGGGGLAWALGGRAV
jgi:hypothetical protein